jgi:hypothetical protein
MWQQNALFFLGILAAAAACLWLVIAACWLFGLAAVVHWLPSRLPSRRLSREEEELERSIIRQEKDYTGYGGLDYEGTMKRSRCSWPQRG